MASHQLRIFSRRRASLVLARGGIPACRHVRPACLVNGRFEFSTPGATRSPKRRTGAGEPLVRCPRRPLKTGPPTCLGRSIPRTDPFGARGYVSAWSPADHQGNQRHSTIAIEIIKKIGAPDTIRTCDLCLRRAMVTSDISRHTPSLPLYINQLAYRFPPGHDNGILQRCSPIVARRVAWSVG